MPKPDIINCTWFGSVSSLSAALHSVNEAKALDWFKPGIFNSLLKP